MEFDETTTLMDLKNMLENTLEIINIELNKTKPQTFITDFNLVQVNTIQNTMRWN